MPIHYSEGAFPLTLYDNNYRDNYKVKHATTNCCDEDMCYANIHETISKHNNHNKSLIVTDVGVSKDIVLSITISYSDGTKEVYKLEPHAKYKIQYTENGELITVVGVIRTIGQVNPESNKCNCTCCVNNDYIISVDLSTEYNSQVVTLRTSQIRGITKYIEFGDEDTDLASCTASGSTVAGDMTNISIVNAVVSDDGIITSGEISNATLVEDKVMVANSCATGLNPNGHKITVRDGIINGGIVIKGKIISGKLTDFQINKKPGEDKSIVIAKSGTIVIDDAVVINATCKDGIIIDPFIAHSTIFGGIRSGTDMITTGSIVRNGIAYGGTSTGGTIYNGTAKGMIDCRPFTIMNGISVGGVSSVSSVTNGKVVGGRKVGDSIIGAVVYGGSATCEYTSGSCTRLGKQSESYIKPNYTSIPMELITKSPDKYDSYESNIRDVVIWWKTEGSTKNNQPADELDSKELMVKLKEILEH